MDDVDIRPIRDGEMDAACEVIGLAFADNPNSLAIAGGDRATARRMMKAGMRVAKLGRKVSYVLIAEQAGAIVGVLNAAEWPNCQMRTAEKLRTAPAMIRALGSALPRAFKVMGIWAKHDPHERHWHVGPIGVRPGLQGRGIGKSLLGSFLVMVDEQRSAAYLETDVDENVLLYAKFGFEVIAREEILGINNRFMWRAAPSATA